MLRDTVDASTPAVYIFSVYTNNISSRVNLSESSFNLFFGRFQSSRQPWFAIYVILKRRITIVLKAVDADYVCQKG